MGFDKMDMNEFLEKYGSNVKTDYSWIFPDNIPRGKYAVIGFDEVKSSTNKEIPTIILQDTESKMKMCLSLWSSDRNSLQNVDVGDIVTLSKDLNKNKVVVSKII